MCSSTCCMKKKFVLKHVQSVQLIFSLFFIVLSSKPLQPSSAQRLKWQLELHMLSMWEAPGCISSIHCSQSAVRKRGQPLSARLLCSNQEMAQAVKQACA